MTTAAMVQKRESSASDGRLVGALMLAHLVCALIVPFVMLLPLINPPGFLISATGVATQIRAAVLLFFVGNAMAIAVASVGWRVFRQYSSPMALSLLALAGAAFSLQAVDNGHILAMLSLSQQYANADASKADLFQGLALVVGAARKWSHYTFLLTVGCWMLLLFALLFRFRLVPRAIAGLAMLCVFLQMTGVSLRGLFGYAPETRLAMPLAPAYILVAVWLIVKGFDERSRGIEGNG
jgi:hypothetical protein